MPETQTQPIYPKGLDFEQVWAALMENREQLKETDRQLKETDRIVKETSKQIGAINNRFGEIVEYMVAPNLQEKFRGFGLNFNETMSTRVFSDDKKFLFEVDVFFAKRRQGNAG